MRVKLEGSTPSTVFRRYQIMLIVLAVLLAIIASMGFVVFVLEVLDDINFFMKS